MMPIYRKCRYTEKKSWRPGNMMQSKPLQAVSNRKLCRTVGVKVKLQRRPQEGTGEMSLL
jgi:hypothetical protein